MTLQTQTAAKAANPAVAIQYGDVQDIPLNRLKASPRNARRVGHTAEDVESRAASIKAKGLLQPLVVEPEIKDGGARSGYYLVSVGEGRRQALKLLAKRKIIGKAEPVRCVVDTLNDPAEISLDENVSRRSIISVQIFVCLIEFKLTTLAGFVLVPFGLFGRTAFLAERVLGNVIAAGIKVLVLAVITGIGSSLFSEFTAAIGPGQPNLETVLALALASLTLLGLSIFGPGIAAGLVSGAPQLGAGAAVGTGVVVGGMAMAGAGAVQMVAGGGASLAASAGAAGGGRPGSSGGGDLRPPSGPTGSGPGPASGAGASSPRGGPVGGGSAGGSDEGGQGGAPPAWARDLRHRQALAHGVALAAHAVAGGDAHGGGANPSLSEDR